MSEGRPWPRKTAASGGCAVRGTSGSGQGAAAGPLVCPKPSPDSKPGCVRCAIHATWQRGAFLCYTLPYVDFRGVRRGRARPFPHEGRSEEHTSELQSLMRISYAVFCLTKKKTR